MFKGIIICLLCLLGLFGLWSFILGYFPFLLFALFLVMFIICFLISIPAMKNTTLSLHTTSHIIERNQDLMITFQRQNISHFPCGKIIIKYAIYDAYNKKIYSIQTNMMGNKSHARVKMKHTGMYNIKIEKYYCYDLLQCFHIQHKTPQNYRFFVFPMLIETNIDLDEATSFHQDAIDYSPYQKGEDYSEIFDLRQYQEGDNLKHVHWNLSSKRGELHVKVGSQPIIKRLLLCLEQSLDKETNDKAIDYFYSISLQLIQRGIAFKIVCPFDSHDYAHIELIKDESYFRDCLMKIMQTPYQSKDDILKSVDKHLEITFVNHKGIN